MIKNTNPNPPYPTQMLKSCLLGVKTGTKEERVAVMGRQVPGRKQPKNKKQQQNRATLLPNRLLAMEIFKKNFFLQFFCFSFVSFMFERCTVRCPRYPL
jgi:hypothetical protein